MIFIPIIPILYEYFLIQHTKLLHLPTGLSYVYKLGQHNFLMPSERKPYQTVIILNLFKEICIGVS